MKKLCILFVLPFFLSGCLYGQCIDGPCALERQRLLKSIKAYGEFWTKPGMTTDSWRLDWVECGGKSNGNYSSESPISGPSQINGQQSPLKIGNTDFQS
jgi:hypothetical protein